MAVGVPVLKLMMAASDSDSELRSEVNVLVIGEKGSGKSTVGNHILKKASFDVDTPGGIALGLGLGIGSGAWHKNVSPIHETGAAKGLKLSDANRPLQSTISLGLALPITGAVVGSGTHALLAQPVPTTAVHHASHIHVSVIDTFALEHIYFLKETRDKVLGYCREVNMIAFVLKYHEEENDEALKFLFDLFDKYFTREVHPITVLVITHCERMNNEEVIKKYTQLCPTDRAGLGIVPVGFTQNPSGPWKGRIVKKIKDDEEVLQKLIDKCNYFPVPANKIFHS